jgi:hypothetical protein
MITDLFIGPPKSLTSDPKVLGFISSDEPPLNSALDAPQISACTASSVFYDK